MTLAGVAYLITAAITIGVITVIGIAIGDWLNHR